MLRRSTSVCKLILGLRLWGMSTKECFIRMRSYTVPRTTARCGRVMRMESVVSMCSYLEHWLRPHKRSCLQKPPGLRVAEHLSMKLLGQSKWLGQSSQENYQVTIPYHWKMFWRRTTHPCKQATSCGMTDCARVVQTLQTRWVKFWASEDLLTFLQ